MRACAQCCACAYHFCIFTPMSSMSGTVQEYGVVHTQSTNRVAMVKPLKDGTVTYTPPLLDIHNRRVPTSEDVKSKVKLMVPTVPAPWLSVRMEINGHDLLRD
jgi:hypothetical protein